MKILFEPQSKYVEQISDWLKKDSLTGFSNFYDNFIRFNLDNNNFICLVDDNDNAIGFIKYYYEDVCGKIEVAVVESSQVRKGLGKLMVETLIDYLKQKGVVAISLDCSPESSKEIWKKLGFKEFKEIEKHKYLNYNNYGRPWMYRILIQVEEPTDKKDLKSSLELWSMEDYLIKDNPPTYVWDLENQTKPIIYPVDCNWVIRKNDNEIGSKEKLKYFNRGMNCINYFMIFNK